MRLSEVVTVRNASHYAKHLVKVHGQEGAERMATFFETECSGQLKQWWSEVRIAISKVGTR